MEGWTLLLISLICIGVVVALMIPTGLIHVKLVLVAAVFLLIGLWRLLRAPWWVRRPDEIERIAPSRSGVEIIMRGGRLYELAVSVAEREELEKELQQRANEIRLRARVVSS